MIGPKLRPRSTFSTSQLIDVHGAHAYVPAGPGDFRGPCPGLNSMANHNYIPHNGIATWEQLLNGSLACFGAGPAFDAVAIALGMYGANLLAPPDFPLSIGEMPPAGIVGGILAPPSGLTNTHNQFEIDASVTRCDLYECGDAHTLQVPLLQTVLDMYTADPDPAHKEAIIETHHANSINHSIANNPYFFFGPIELVIGSGAPLLIPALFANHSAEFPDGYISTDALMSIYGGHRYPNGTLYWTRGTERIPENFYRTPGWDAEDFVPYFVDMWTKYPQTFILGGNTGTVNSFVPLDVANFTNGVYNAEMLLQGNNLACFLYQTTQLLVPSQLANAELFVQVALGIISSIGFNIAQLACPQLETVKLEQLDQYPGWVRSKKSM
ncbi:Chloroperoxidase [Mycena galopus ATCC 62051]|nr:Chloroperoxidase [Mycena galopus ATCC 62051]